MHGVYYLNFKQGVDLALAFTNAKAEMPNSGALKSKVIVLVKKTTTVFYCIFLSYI